MRRRRNPYTRGLSAGHLAVMLCFAGCAENTEDGGLQGPEQQPPGTESGFMVATLLHGTESGRQDLARDVAVDAQGNVYVTGGTSDPGFPTTSNAYQKVFGRGLPPTSTGSQGGWDVFVMKFGPDGTLIWSTFLGGPNYDRAYAVEVDASGVYVAGRAGEGFPTTAGTVQQTFAGDDRPLGAYGKQDGFIAKLSLDGSTLVWATYFGGPSDEFLRDLAVDSNGDLYPAVSVAKHAFPYVSAQAFQTTNHGQGDGAACRLTAGATAVRWCTFIGGSTEDGIGPSVRLDGSGNVYYLQSVTSTDAPTTSNAYQTVAGGGGSDVLLSKLSPEGTMLFSTYFGGNGYDDGETHNLWVTASGEAFVGAWTTSTNLPASPAAFQTRIGDAAKGDGFLARFSADGRQLLACTYLGGSAEDLVEGLGMDGAGNVIVSGTTGSGSLPISSDAAQRTSGGGLDGFIAVLTPALTSVVRASYIGGSGTDYARSVAIDNVRGIIYTGGNTESANFPTTASALLRQYTGFDAFFSGWQTR